MKNRQKVDLNLTIDSIVGDGLCTGCGTCIGICPKEAITLTNNKAKGIYLPKRDREKCNLCGVCYAVCPGYSVDRKKLNMMVFSKEPDDVLLGNYINCYTGHTNDYNIRYNAASGGLVTQFLIFALEEKIIDGALVTSMKRENPLEPEPFIARTREEIIDAGKSKYCPVPANVALKEIIELDTSEKFAVVGLPCHINGVRKAQLLNAQLRDRVVLCLGLFCAKAITFRGTEFLLQRLNIEKSTIERIDYRGKGWPGGMSIRLKNGRDIFIPLSEYYDYRFGMFTPFCCTVCNDYTSELADITFGDAWLPEFAGDKTGQSMIITRTSFTEEILQRMISKKLIEINKIGREQVIQSQGGFRYKKETLATRRFLLKVMGRKVPLNYQKVSHVKVGGLFLEIRAYLWSLVARTRYFKLLLGVRAFLIKVRKFSKFSLMIL